MSGAPEKLSAEDYAAMILVHGFLPGCAWAPLLGPPAIVDGEEGDQDSPETLHITRETETLELASRALHPKSDREHAYVLTLPPGERVKVREWSRAHSLRSKGVYRVREFQHWKTGGARFRAVIPNGSAVAGALAYAGLRGPERPTLELHALQEPQHIATVTRYLLPELEHPAIAEHSIERWLYPHVYSGHTFSNGARALRMRKADYGNAVGLGVTRLREWLHSASRKFLHAWSARE